MKCTAHRNFGAAAWVGMGAALAGLALLGQLAPSELLDWQVSVALNQPWRFFSAVAVHYGVQHLVANLCGVALVATLGWQAGVSTPMVVAWGVAWPLTHAALWLDPQLAHYGGLSGVLHAGVAVASVHLVLCTGRWERHVGALLLVGLALKLGWEFPWVPTTFHAGLGIQVAPLAHLGGAAAGLACGLAGVCQLRMRATKEVVE